MSIDWAARASVSSSASARAANQVSRRPWSRRTPRQTSRSKHGDELLVGRQGEQPARVLEADRAAGVTELGFGQQRDHRLGIREQLDQLAPDRKRGVQQERRLALGRKGGEGLLGGAAILSSQLEEAPGFGRGFAREVHEVGQTSRARRRAAGMPRSSPATSR